LETELRAILGTEKDETVSSLDSITRNFVTYTGHLVQLG